MRVQIWNRCFSETFLPMIFVAVLAIFMIALTLPMGGAEAHAGRAARSCGREIIDFVDPLYNTDPRVTYEGAWLGESYDGAYGGELVLCQEEEAALEVTFYGRYVRLVAARYWTCGECAVYLDGEYKGTVNLFSERTRYRYTVFSAFFLRRGHHTLRLVNLGEPGSEYPYHFVNVDYMVVW